MIPGWLVGTFLLAVSSACAASAVTANATSAAGDDTRPQIRSNDNRLPAGRLKDGVLTLRLEAREGTWYPEGPDGLARAVAAFAEEGGPLQNPGPLIRVPAGTEVRVSVRNSLGVPLRQPVHRERRGVQADTFRIEPGAVREMRLSAPTPGLYYYAGTTDEPWDEVPDDGIHPVFHRTGPDSQLNGVIVVDPPGAVQPARDRIFVISRWGRRDPSSATGVDRRSVMVINGLSWPHTERFEVTQDDSLHWRWVSLTNLGHPMHLHGFYFRVDGKGDGVQDTVYEPAAVHWHGIELESFPDGVPDWSGMGSTLLRAIPVRDSLTVRFTPPRAGTFMYHSHFNELQQISSGLYGAIVVLEPGRPYDPEADRLLIFSDAHLTINPVVGPIAVPLLNGHAQPEPIELRAGVTYRFRLVNIRSHFPVAVALLAGDHPVEWRHVAKDGAALPPAQAIVRPAQLAFGVGEIHDVEFTLHAPGDLTLRFGFPPRFRLPGVPVPAPTLVPVRVR